MVENERITPLLISLMLLSNRAIIRGSLAVAAAFTLVGAQSVSAHHVLGDDHTGTLLTVDPSATAQGMKTMFSTRAEAEAAAVNFDCEGAHQMGNMWMPCTEH